MSDLFSYQTVQLIFYLSLILALLLFFLFIRKSPAGYFYHSFLIIVVIPSAILLLLLCAAFSCYFLNATTSISVEVTSAEYISDEYGEMILQLTTAEGRIYNIDSDCVSLNCDLKEANCAVLTVYKLKSSSGKWIYKAVTLYETTSTPTDVLRIQSVTLIAKARDLR